MLGQEIQQGTGSIDILFNDNLYFDRLEHMEEESEEDEIIVTDNDRTSNYCKEFKPNNIFNKIIIEKNIPEIDLSIFD